MSLAEQIIEHGPYPDGEINQLTLNGDEANALREELLELRRLRAQAEALKHIDVSGLGRDDRDVEAHCNRCGVWYATLDAYSALDELVQRAGEHAEVCR